MATRNDAERRTDRNDRPDEERYAAITVDGGVVVYDRENPRAWLESDEPVASDEWR